MSFPIELLRCPISAQTMQAAPSDLLRSLQERQQSGTLRTHGGEPAEPFEDGLLSADGVWFYPIRAGIPAMLASEGIPVPSSDASPGQPPGNVTI